MFAQLGSIIFENLKSFTDYKKSGSATYAEHALLSGKPRLKRTGSSLDEISISARFHASFCNPLNELDALVSYKEEGEVLSLLFGGKVLQGSFVITDINETIEEASHDGFVISYLVDFTLKEYVVPNKLQQIQADDKQKAKAVGDKKPVAKKKTNPSTCPQTISGIVGKIDNHSKSVNTIILEKGGIMQVNYRALVLHHLAVIKDLSTGLLSKSNDPNSCAYAYSPIKISCQQVLQSEQSFTLKIETLGLDLNSENKSLQLAVKNLKTSTSQLTNQAITRK